MTEEQTNDETEETPIQEAKRIVAEAKEATAELKKERIKLEEAKAIEVVSGKANAGEVPAKPKEETAKEYADKVLAGDKNE